VSAGALGIALVLLLVNGVFVAFEFALVASQRARLEKLEAYDTRRGTAAAAALGTLSRQLAGVQLGVTMASLALGAVAEPSIGHGLEQLFGHLLPHGAAGAAGLGVALLIVTAAHSIFGELVPRSLAMAKGERALLALSLPMAAFVKLFGPVVSALNALATGCLRLFGITRRDELASVRSIDEIGVLLAQAADTGVLEPASHERLTGALAFAERTVESVMVPRDKIVAVRRTTSVADAEQRFVSFGLSRLPVIGRDVDDVLGFIHAKDLLEIRDDDRHLPIPSRSIRRMLIVSTNRRLDELLVSMRRARLHVALVLGPDATTAGLVTLEDGTSDPGGRDGRVGHTRRRWLSPGCAGSWRSRRYRSASRESVVHLPARYHG
jgi:CBS domain containing-hemolysin-like protein